MMTDVVEQSGGMTRSGADDPVGAARTGADERSADAGTARTGTDEAEAATRIIAIRERIDEIDHALIALWQERASLSRQVGATRVASGGTRLVLSREREILERFRVALGADGTQLALLLLRAGRGPL